MSAVVLDCASKSAQILCIDIFFNLACIYLLHSRKNMTPVNECIDGQIEIQVEVHGCC